jgi:hypothetical protein
LAQYGIFTLPAIVKLAQYGKIALPAIVQLVCCGRSVRLWQHAYMMAALVRP